MHRTAPALAAAVAIARAALPAARPLTGLALQARICAARRRAFSRAQAARRLAMRFSRMAKPGGLRGGYYALRARLARRVSLAYARASAT